MIKNVYLCIAERDDGDTIFGAVYDTPLSRLAEKCAKSSISRWAGIVVHMFKT